MVALDCSSLTTNKINRHLQTIDGGEEVRLVKTDGRHNLAVGLNRSISVRAEGHVGYYFGGMNRDAQLRVDGNAGTGLGENMMSGMIRVGGSTSASTGASAHGGLIVVEGDASIRCGISLKGGSIVIGGNVGNMCGFMAQLGCIVICGDAGEALGDSLYEAVLFVRGDIRSLGADARVETFESGDHKLLSDLLDQAGLSHQPEAFRRVGSARSLYHFDAESHQRY